MMGAGRREPLTSIAPMPGQLRNVVLGALAATVIAGCGSDDGTIPPDNARDLITRLEAIDEQVSLGQCSEAQTQAETFASDVEELPGSVDNEVQRGLEESASRLVSLTSSECEPEEGASGADGAVTTETEPTTTEETTTEETTTEETTTEEPADEESPEPEDEQPQEDPDLAPPSENPGEGVGQDGGVGPSGGVGSGGDD
jgi:hypothetical protein